MLRLIAKALILPPMGCFVLAGIGLLLRRRMPRLSRALLIISPILLWLLCTPLVGGTLLNSLQTEPALPALAPAKVLSGDHTGEQDDTAAPALPPADAIVILGAEVEPRAPEYAQSAPGRNTLMRLRYGAHLHHRTGLPVLVSGGTLEPEVPPVATVMRQTLERDFHTPVRWVENAAEHTWDNATLSASLLAKDGIQRIYLVTHAWHMPRARASFVAQGFTVIPAPTGFRRAPWQGIYSLIPNWSALRDSYRALHEWIGRGVYAVFRY